MSFFSSKIAEAFGSSKGVPGEPRKLQGEKKHLNFVLFMQRSTWLYEVDKYIVLITVQKLTNLKIEIYKFNCDILILLSYILALGVVYYHHCTCVWKSEVVF